MNILKWLVGHFSGRGKALSRYRRGMVKAKQHDHQGAIADYTVTIKMPGTPDDVKGMVLYNRALVHAAMGDDRRAVGDLDAVLAMEEAPDNVKAMARQKLVRMQTRTRASDEQPDDATNAT